MALYLISYDLTHKPESDYEDLIAYIRDDLGGIRVLYSEWLVASDMKAVAVRDALKAYMKDNDLWWVLEVTTNSAWFRTRGGQAVSDQAKALFRYARS